MSIPRRSTMKKITAFVAVAALFAAAVPPAQAAKGVPYKGKTTGGHKISFRYAKGKMLKLVTGVPMTCISIQGGGSPMTGVEPFYADWVVVPLRPYTFKEKSKPAMYYGEVTKTHRISTRRNRNGTISGSLRTQYSFLIPKYPIGTFTIYSCLGNMKFSARPSR
jgi:hypothetical protein